MAYCLLFCVTVWSIVYGQECLLQPCKCCVVPYTRCRSSIDYCLDGCKDGIYGNRCYNPCPGNCAICTQGGNGYPCTQCKDTTLYGDNCDTPCSAGCLGGTCELDGSCTCTAGYSGDKCDVIDLVCPDKCNTCTAFNICQTCVDGYYNGNKYGSNNGDYTSVCKHPCSTRPHCKVCTGYNSCDQCDDGYYGQNCETPCSSGCQHGTCIRESGNCDCKLSFNGEKCDQCNAGKYLDDCSINCLSHNCMNNICIRDSGRCSSCNTGYYGNNLCDKSCSVSCTYGTCGFTSGTCTRGCNTGYSGDKCCLNNNNCDTCLSNTECSVCKTGYSGDKCCVNNNYCETCSSSTTCSKCKNGYSGDKCCLQNEYCETCLSLIECSKCIDGRHGVSCTDTCPGNCDETSCSRDGTCVNCKLGFYGSKCENECIKNCEKCSQNGECTECVDGYYGSTCDKCIDNCAKCISKTTCQSCVKGYFGSNCDRCFANCVSCSSISYCDNCETGYYGDTCQTECSKCKEGTNCRKSNGYCEEACKDGMNGQSCNNKCNSGCDACDRTYASRCTVCANGRYGKYSGNTYYNCNNYCSFQCFQKDCNGSNGYCYKCIEGYKGDLCDCPINCQCTETGKCGTCVENFANIDTNCTECALNLYGINCQTECNNNCLDNGKNTKCHGVNGTCIVGCADGFYGDKCDLRCDQNCQQFVCSRSHGICSHGCQEGFKFTGSSCVFALSEVVNEGVSVAIFGGAIGGVVAIGMISVIVVLLIKRRNNRPPCCRVTTNDGTHNQDNTKHVYVNTTDNATGNSSMPDASEYHELGEITNDIPVVIEDDTETITHDYESLDEQQREHGNYDDLVVPQYVNTNIEN